MQEFGTDTTRRQFMKSILAVSATVTTFPAIAADKNHALDFPLEDLHVHLTPDFTLEHVKAQSEKLGVKCGIVQHPGGRYRDIGVDDEALLKYISTLDPYPFYKAVQPVSPGWRSDFSAEVIAKLDYVIMDAMELPNPDGTFFCIWMDDTQISDKDKFMDRYLDFHLQIMSEEGINILASPTFLPSCLHDEYDQLWTEKRMRTIIESAVQNNVALEIGAMYKIPNEKFVRLAKASGAKFTFGTNGRTPETAAVLDYSIDMAAKCGLSKKDMFTPDV